MTDDDEAYLDSLVPLYDSLEAWACEYGIDAATVERIRHDMELTADGVPPVTLH